MCLCTSLCESHSIYYLSLVVVLLRKLVSVVFVIKSSLGFLLGLSPTSVRLIFGWCIGRFLHGTLLIPRSYWIFSNRVRNRIFSVGVRRIIPVVVISIVRSVIEPFSSIRFRRRPCYFRQICVVDDSALSLAGIYFASVLIVVESIVGNWLTRILRLWIVVTVVPKNNKFDRSNIF